MGCIHLALWQDGSQPSKAEQSHFYIYTSENTICPYIVNSHLRVTI